MLAGVCAVLFLLYAAASCTYYVAMTVRTRISTPSAPKCSLGRTFPAAFFTAATASHALCCPSRVPTHWRTAPLPLQIALLVSGQMGRSMRKAPSDLSTVFLIIRQARAQSSVHVFERATSHCLPRRKRLGVQRVQVAYRQHATRRATCNVQRCHSALRRTWP